MIPFIVERPPVDEVNDPLGVGLQADGELEEGSVVVELRVQLGQDPVGVRF